MTESNGWVACDGYEKKTIKTPNATIEIICPILAPEEQARRVAGVIDAMKSYLRKEGKQ